ncbi:MAG TPA: ABC transporter ATP-binding protein [Pyrinomonadaceae bacterium]|jgi:ABC-2 type transport system ATP-binding protein|nr:ABC transporter ATP-binding protein [Pyrinomonadaceae bacterium]
MTDAPAAISIEDLSKTYPPPLAGFRRVMRMKTRPAVEALRGVSISVGEGEVFGLIGRNGAGKTTLTKIIATLVQPTSGSVGVRGFDSVRDEERVRAQVGLATAEERSFYWRLTVEQNLTFFARLYGMDGALTRRRIGELLELLELGELRRRRFGELSTGNKQRMAVARSLLNSPPVLLLDEPTRSLDPLAAARMRETIGSLARGTPPATILLTSHNLAEVEELCDRVAVISRGRIRAVDTPAHLRSTSRQEERVRVTVADATKEQAASLLDGVVPGAETRAQGENVVVAFTREVGDDLVDRALRALVGTGPRVVAVESERATLLDVIESFEREGGEGGDG